MKRPDARYQLDAAIQPAYSKGCSKGTWIYGTAPDGRPSITIVGVGVYVMKYSYWRRIVINLDKPDGFGWIPNEKSKRAILHQSKKGG